MLFHIMFYSLILSDLWPYTKAATVTCRYYIDDSVLDKVPSMFMLLGGCYTAMQIVGVVLLFPNTKQSAFGEEHETLIDNEVDR